MTLHLRPRRSASTFLSSQPSYPSAEPDTDLRRLFAGSKWNAPETAGFPMRAASGKWMIPVIIDLPYAMLASLEAAAQSDEFGDLIRAALVAGGIVRRTISKAFDRIDLQRPQSGMRSPA